jgi:hypothetical protein
MLFEMSMVSHAANLGSRFKAHGKWINPMRDQRDAETLETEDTQLGVRALDFAGCGLTDAPVRKLGENITKVLKCVP